MPLPISNPKIVSFSNYPDAWQIRYREKNYLAVDPTVHHGNRSIRPILWSDDVFTSSLDLWEDAQSFGLRIGWAQATRDMNGVSGMLTLARSSETITPQELREKGPKMMWLSHFAHISMSRRLTAKIMPEAEVNLTEREVEVLRWTAEGKTSYEVAEIIGITERTINYHINNAVAKLNASNKTAAAIRAGMLGLLY